MASAVRNAPDTVRYDSPITQLSTSDISLFVIRLMIGVIMVGHGSQKLFGWFSGGGISGTGKFFESVGYDPGKTFAVIAGCSEILGGLGLVAGLLTPLAGAAVLGTMINAASTKWSTMPFIGGYEFELLLATCGGAIALGGPGRIALDSFIPALNRRSRIYYGIGGVVLALVLGGITLVLKK